MKSLAAFAGVAAAAALAGTLVWAQQPVEKTTPEKTPPEVTTAKQPASEMNTSDAPVRFTSRVNLVPVTVVVRDLNGHAVGNLTKEDFRLFDGGKLQTITRFSVEKPGAPPVVEKEEEVPGEPAKQAEAPPPVIAEHFVAYLFDDVHTKFDDLARAREAASKVLATTLQPGDRVAIYTTSGQVMLEFTNDLDQLQDTLLRIRPIPGGGGLDSGNACPYITYYMADRIVNLNDQQALQVATANYQACSEVIQVPTGEIISFAQRELTAGEHAIHLATTSLQTVIRRIAAMPGQRSIILASPGFVIPTFSQYEITDIINRAIRANVVISTLDSRGLWTDPTYDASRAAPAGGATVLALISTYLAQEQSAMGDVLRDLADGTGGAFFQNSNDLKSGFQRVSVAPEYLYVLGFSPQNLKNDGKFHSLKVSLVNARGLTLQTRKGYYAPLRQTGAAEQIRQELEEAVFSREVMKDIPVTVHTQFFKTSDYDAKLSVIAQVDVRALRFRKVDGRNRDDLTVVAALFDTNGNLISGNEKKVELRLKDETLANKLSQGMTLKTPFDVKTGAYVVRVVVRDSEGEMIAAQNSSVQIP